MRDPNSMPIDELVAAILCSSPIPECPICGLGRTATICGDCAPKALLVLANHLAEKTIISMSLDINGGWLSAVTCKPVINERVCLFRKYAHPTFKHVTGFTSVGRWDGSNWRDELLGCCTDDVKFFHVLPSVPLGVCV